MNEQALRFILRMIGGASLFALIFIFVPYEWMNEIHHGIGLGELPEAPVVGYLARSVSAFYALFGGLFLLLSLDVKRHRELISAVGLGTAFLGLALLFIDWHEGLPFWWKVWEGPFVTVVGLAIFGLSRKMKDKG
ncbi:MAG: hypothetical protein H6628_19080 [Calditrichae bacterium]|nr:hypothetical protein [Calditrichia bacterium]